MAKPNYSFQKRQKEIERKKKQDEKQQRKQQEKDELAGSAATGEPGSDADDGPASA